MSKRLRGWGAFFRFIGVSVVPFLGPGFRSFSGTVDNHQGRSVQYEREGSAVWVSILLKFLSPKKSSFATWLYLATLQTLALHGKACALTNQASTEMDLLAYFAKWYLDVSGHGSKEKKQKNRRFSSFSFKPTHGHLKLTGSLGEFLPTKPTMPGRRKAGSLNLAQAESCFPANPRKLYPKLNRKI